VSLSRIPVRTLLVLAALAALVPAAWLQLQTGPTPAGPLARTLALALAPALLLLLAGKRAFALAAAPLALLVAAGYAFGVPVTHMRKGTVDFWGPLLSRVDAGFADFYSTRVPFEPADHPYMEAIVLVAIFLFLVVGALLVVWPRPLVAAVLTLLALGWPATIAATIPGATPLRTGAVLLGAVLVFLLLTRERRRPVRAAWPALAFGALLVVTAVAASSSGAVAKAGVLHWQRWNYHPPPKQVGVRYVWSSNYTGISFPKKKTEVLRIKGPSQSLYWRATTLDVYTGIGWTEQLVTGPVEEAPVVDAAVDDPLLPRVARDPANWTRQDVTVEGLADRHLIAASVPVRWEPAGGEPTQYAQGGVVVVPDGLHPNERYTVWSYTPTVQPQSLAKLPARYPQALARYLEILPDVTAPAFGTPGREAAMQSVMQSDPLLASYEPMYQQALRVIGKAKSPYVAAAALETWFRSEGGFAYSEHPAQPVNGTPPLLDFVVRTRQGYCQHFAGAMALMLRMIGIPARVAAGFTSGTFDKNRGEWVVTDHNAHTWVEVYFPQFGWLPFDPTPGRGVLGVGSSTTSPEYAAEASDLLQTLSAYGAPSALKARLQGDLPSDRIPQGGTLFPSGFASTASSRGPSIAAIVFAVLACTLVLLLGTKELRRRLRFRSRDPRRIATACQRDLLAYLADQGMRLPASATLLEVGHLVEQRYRVTAAPFVAAALAARFGPPVHAADAARRARRELRQLERAMRYRLPWTTRLRGALSLRSLPI
jgi:transglutaminase-like putative cysteine protease